MKSKFLISLIISLAAIFALSAQISYPGNDPGKAKIQLKSGKILILENDILKLDISIIGEKIRPESFENKVSGDRLAFNKTSLFELSTGDSSIFSSDDFVIVKAPALSDIIANSGARTYSDRISGKKCVAELENQKLGLKVRWEIVLKDGSNYIRQIFTFTSPDNKNFSKIVLLKIPAGNEVKKTGKVDGSPLAGKNMFFALEHPLSKTEQNSSHLLCYLPRLMSVVSSSWGVTPPNQARRGFLYYLERERMHPYHHAIHYNSWYDISWDNRKFNEKECLDRIKGFGDSLILKRNIALKAFLFDDGWDDNASLWRFHSGFPDGFTNVRKACEGLGSTLGVWFSPFGGYGKAKKSRIEYGNKQNPPFETNQNGFSLAGPVYYSRLMEVTTSFLKDYNTSMFKFDGIGAGSGADVTYQRDVEAFLKLLNELTTIKPDLYLSLTTGTWPSPFWLFYGDNIWRGGGDTGMQGEGSNRQKWINYRDAETYKNVVGGGPLYPMNSLMLGGICIADNGEPGTFEMNDKDISDEIWSFFATGTNLQELYVNPHKLNTANWDCLAAAIKWARENESVLADVHWVGGDPAKGEIYGFAAWSPEKAVLCLRNPSKVEKTFEVNAEQVFEIPVKTRSAYSFFNAKTGEKNIPVAEGVSFKLSLDPYEVIVMNALPKK